MTKTLLTTTTALALLWAAPAVSQAQLPALLEGLEAMAGATGSSLTYGNKVVGADFSVEYTDIEITEQGGAGSVIALDWLKVTPSADVPGQITVDLPHHATVTVADSSFPEPYVIDIVADGVTATLDNVIPGAGGEAAAVWNYVLAIPMLSVTGSGENPVFQDLSFAATDLTTTVTFTPETQTVTAQGGLQALVYAFNVISPDGPFGQSGNLVQMAYDMAFDAVGEDQMTEYLTGARSAHLNYNAASGNSAAHIENQDITIDMATQAIQGAFNIALENGIFTMAASNGVSNIQMNELVIEGTPIPPFTIAMTGMEIGARVPVANTGTADLASVKMAIHDLVAPESLIGMIDPGQTIPRTPMNLNIDVAATAINNIDWSNPEAAFNSGNPMDIVEVQSIDIRQILLAAGGAQITATGKADMDNSMGIPQPTGMVTITASGMQALVNALVGLQLIPSDQAGMMMGMMMGYARAEGTDNFVSDIEFSPEGVTANGSPLPF